MCPSWSPHSCEQDFLHALLNRHAPGDNVATNNKVRSLYNPVWRFTEILSVFSHCTLDSFQLRRHKPGTSIVRGNQMDQPVPPNPTSVEDIKRKKALPVPPPVFSPRSSLPAHLHRKYVKALPAPRDIILRHHT
jgi:hypothetical protein